MLNTRNPSDPAFGGATSPLASRRRGGFWLTYRGYRGRSAPIFNRTRRRVRRGRGLFCGREPVDQSKKGFLADLPPGNRLRFQANLSKGWYWRGKQFPRQAGASPRQIRIFNLLHAKGAVSKRPEEVNLRQPLHFAINPYEGTKKGGEKGKQKQTGEHKPI